MPVSASVRLHAFDDLGAAQVLDELGGRGWQGGGAVGARLLACEDCIKTQYGGAVATTPSCNALQRRRNLVVAPVVVGVLIWLISPGLRRWMHGVE